MSREIRQLRRAQQTTERRGSKNRPAENQGRIIHCAGCTLGGGRRRQGAPADQLPNLYHAGLKFER